MKTYYQFLEYVSAFDQRQGQIEAQHQQRIQSLEKQMENATRSARLQNAALERSRLAQEKAQQEKERRDEILQRQADARRRESEQQQSQDHT